MFGSPTYLVNILIILVSSVRTMPPRREPRPSAEPSFLDIAQLEEVIANAIKSSLHPPQMTHLETVYNLKLNHFMGNEEAERWLNHIEKTFCVMQSQCSLSHDRWVETTTWFLGPEPASWWRQESYQLSPNEAVDWEVFKQLFQKRFILPEYIDPKKQEFMHLKHEKMSAYKYYKRFADLSRYDLEVATNTGEMLRRFRLGTRKKRRSMATTTPYATYQEFYEILLWIEDSENMPSESDGEKDNQKKKDDKDKGQSSQGPRKTQIFKRSGASSSSSS
ncbi:hypothetical protein ACFX2J_043943 [Malus domestica]